MKPIPALEKAQRDAEKRLEPLRRAQREQLRRMWEFSKKCAAVQGKRHT